jgi:HK97 family phage major capsid protein
MHKILWTHPQLVRAETNGGFIGVGVPNGSPEKRDAYGTFWTRETANWLQEGDTVWLTEFHTLEQETPTVAGRAKYLGMQDEGAIFSLDIESEHYRALAEEGNLYLSSATASHLARFDDNGQVLAWPVVEIALLDIRRGEIPANFDAKLRTEQLSGFYALRGADLPRVFGMKAEQEKPTRARTPRKRGNKKMKITPTQRNLMLVALGANVLNEEVATAFRWALGQDIGEVETPEADLEATVLRALETVNLPENATGSGAEPGLPGALRSAPTQETRVPGYQRLTERGFNEDEQKRSFIRYTQTGDAKPAFEMGMRAVPQLAGDAPQTRANDQFDYSVAEQGAVQMPEVWLNEIYYEPEDVSFVNDPKLGPRWQNEDAAVVNWIYEDTALTKMDIVERAADGTMPAKKDDATVRALPVTNFLHKKKVLWGVREVYKSIVSYETHILSRLKDVWVETVQDHLINGTGTNEPQGVVGCATGKTFASATAITPPEVVEFIYKMPSKYRSGAVLLMSSEIQAYVMSLTQTPNWGFVNQIVNEPGNDNPLVTRPIFNDDSLETAHATGDIVMHLANYRRGYAAVRSANISVFRLNELHIEDALQGVVMFARVGGRRLFADAFSRAVMG